MDPDRRLLLAALPGLTLLAMGCPKGAGELSRAARALLPQVRFDKVQLDSINFDKVDLRFLFAVENPAPLQVALDSFSYALALEGKPLFDGKNPDGVKLAAEATSHLPFPLTLRWGELAELLRETKGKDELGFGLRGELGFDTPVGVLALPYEARGKLPALRRPRFRLEGLRLVELNTSVARLGLDLGVTNLGGSPIRLSGFDYGLHLGGEKVASGLVAALGEVGADTAKSLTLPIDLRLANLGAALIEAFTGKGRVKARIKAGLQVATPWGDIPLEIDEADELNIG